MKRSYRLAATSRTLIACVVATSLLFVVFVVGPAPAIADPPAEPQVTLPDPEAGSFFTVFEYTGDGRIVAFDGFTVHVQESRDSAQLTPIGTLPEEFRGGTDPAFVSVSPNGRTILLGAGAGGSKFPDESFNGNIFSMPIGGGEAQLIGRYMWSILGTWLDNDTFVFGEGETFGTFTGSVEALDVQSGQTTTIVANIPGDPGGVAFDNKGNLYVGLGSGQDSSRTGEIRRFDRDVVVAALAGQGFVDFDDGALIAQVLNAGDLAFSSNGKLFVSGANFSTGEGGYIAEVDVQTGEVVRRFDPADGNPDDGDFGFYELAFTHGRCTLGALDLFSFFGPDPSVVYAVQQVCAS